MKDHAVKAKLLKFMKNGITVHDIVRNTRKFGNFDEVSQLLSAMIDDGLVYSLGKKLEKKYYITDTAEVKMKVIYVVAEYNKSGTKEPRIVNREEARLVYQKND